MTGSTKRILTAGFVALGIFVFFAGIPSFSNNSRRLDNSEYFRNLNNALINFYREESRLPTPEEFQGLIPERGYMLMSYPSSLTGLVLMYLFDRNAAQVHCCYLYIPDNYSLTDIDRVLEYPGLLLTYLPPEYLRTGMEVLDVKSLLSGNGAGIRISKEKLREYWLRQIMFLKTEGIHFRVKEEKIPIMPRLNYNLAGLGVSFFVLALMIAISFSVYGKTRK